MYELSNQMKQIWVKIKEGFKEENSFLNLFF